MRWPLFSPSSKYYPLYSLNVASMWLKLGRLYMGLENKAAGEKALKKVGPGSWMAGAGWPGHTSHLAWLEGSSVEESSP